MTSNRPSRNRQSLDEYNQRIRRGRLARLSVLAVFIAAGIALYSNFTGGSVPFSLATTFLTSPATRVNQPAAVRQKPASITGSGEAVGKPPIFPSAVKTLPIGSPVRLKLSAATACCTEYGHTPRYAIDGNPNTIWHAEEGKHRGNHWLHLVLAKRHRITHLGMIGGNPRLWSQNNRIKTILARFDEGKVYTLTFKNQRGMQSLALTPPAISKTIQIEIQSVYPGSRWHHFIISEILIQGTPE